jgi:hypothetical protein
VDGITLVQDFKCLYNARCFNNVSWCFLFGSFYDTCNKVMCVVIRFVHTIVHYYDPPDFDQCSLPSISVYCHNVV